MTWCWCFYQSGRPVLIIVLTPLSAGAQQVDDVVVVTQMTEDLQLGHQSFALVGESARCLTPTQ